MPFETLQRVFKLQLQNLKEVDPAALSFVVVDVFFFDRIKRKMKEFAIEK